MNLVTTEKRRTYLVSEPNYHSTKFFTENVLAIEMKKTQILMNKLVHLGTSILQLSKYVMYEFYNDYVKPKYGEKAKLCYMFYCIHKKEMIFKDIAEVAETRFNTLIYELDIALPKSKNKKVIDIMKEEFMEKQ